MSPESPSADLPAQFAAARAQVEAQRRLLWQLLELSERERRLLAYEIHDGLVQDITAGLMRLEGYAARTSPDSAEAAELSEIIELLRKGVVEARGVISGLRPVALDEAGVVAAITQLASSHQAATGMDAQFHYQLDTERLAAPLATTLFRIVQEALTNARRHSEANSVTIDLVQRGERLHLTIADDGRGFDAATVGEQSFGLQGIRERSRLLGGLATVTSAPGQGTKIEVELPVLPA